MPVSPSRFGKKPEANNMKTSVAAILTGDLHLGHSCPPVRQVEKTGQENQKRWYRTMGCALAEIQSLAAEHRCPIVVAGDLFQSWREPAELVNFILNQMRPGIAWYAIPGNHDVPHHDPDQ